MPHVKPSAHPVSAVLVADLVASRTASDRRALHAAFREAMEAVNTDPGSDVLEPLRITVGDECQGRFATVGAALAATLRLRLGLSPIGDIRCGVGWGETVVLDDEGTQDGPAWWAARAAIEWVAQAQEVSATEQVRTAYRSGQTEGPGEPEVNAALLCRDHLVGSLDSRSRRVLGGLMSGRTQAEMAEAEGVSPSAISQRIRRDGLGLIVMAHAELREVR